MNGSAVDDRVNSEREERLLRGSTTSSDIHKICSSELIDGEGGEIGIHAKDEKFVNRRITS